MNYDTDNMQRAMMRLHFIHPWAVKDLAEYGPLEEPLCGVCSTLNPILVGKLSGYHLAERILMFHDEWVYKVDDEDYMKAIGLAGCLTYFRCLEIYEFARRCLAEDLRLPRGGAGDAGLR